MPNSYLSTTILTECLWNNAFAWEKRIEKYQKNPTLIIPSCITGTIGDVKIGKEVVFEEIEDDILKSCKWLENFVRILPEKTEITIPEIVVFDNHNHALYFWIEAMRKWIISKWFELFHIDEHSDLWNNEYELNLDEAIKNPQYAWDFVNLSCNVGNYILPAIECGLVNNIIRIENEYQIDAQIHTVPQKNSILNLDLDIFAPELDHIPENKKIRIIRNLLSQVKYVTIATSPFFIEQWKAIEMLRKILQKSE